MSNRRDFLKKTLIAAGSVPVAGAVLSSCAGGVANVGDGHSSGVDDKYRLIPKDAGLPITGTFLDEITWDIPSQNWGYDKWNKDFAAMKKMGIDTVILIRGAFGRYMTFRSDVLMKHEGTYMYEPAFDLLGMFLDLADKHGMKFYCGIFDTGRYWLTGDFKKEVEINKLFLDEIWEKYGHHASFYGWYLSQEVSRRTGGIVESFAEIGKHAKALSGNKPCLISPYIHGLKTDQVMGGDQATTVEQHIKDWTEILSGIKGSVDVMAFQDGQVDYHELKDYLIANRELAEKFNIECWTNVESFDRDMPIRFLPIRWDKLVKKLVHSQEASMAKAITFEFSHFMSPNSAYEQAGNLYRLYREHFDLIN
jgi:sugar phosphate isomerase/epimerase